jgi:chromosome segregation ATPase
MGMANDNKKSNKLVSEQDDDPTAELELLSEADCVEDTPIQQVEAESDANTFDFDKHEADVGGSDETIARLKSDLQSRTESIDKLQFDIEQLRSRWSGLEKEIEVREEVTKNLTEDLKAAHKKQSRTDKRLKKRDKEIESLQAQLSDRTESLKDSARLLEQSKEQVQELNGRTDTLQAKLDAAEKKLSAAEKESQLERSEKQDTKVELQSLSDELRKLKKELSASRASAAELQQYVDCRKSDWEKQEALLRENNISIEQLTNELTDANVRLQDNGSAHVDLNTKLESLKVERDDLLKEITQLRKDTNNEDSAAADKRLLAEQTGMLAGKDFEISELNNQISRTESYADELRRQLQDQLAVAEELQTRQKHLEISLTSANMQVRELSEGIEELRSNNATLLEEKTGLREEFEKEVRQIRFELGEAQETIADRESLTHQLTSDLVDTRESNMNLESRLSTSEEENKATIAKLKRELSQIKSLNEELNEKLSTKDNAIAALLEELTKRSEAIESIGEIEDAIHDLDDRMSERIDEKGGVERERITRLLIGKIDGQKLRFPLFKNRLTIGRTGHNDIQLKAPYISRRHAVIVTDDGSTRIVDWGSKNGVYVNTDRVKEKILRNGDIVTIGTADFKFEERPKR